MQNNEDTVAEAFHISLMDHMLQLGNFTNVFNLDYDKWSKLLPTNTLISSVWKYLFHYKNRLDFANLPTYEIPYENDIFLMEAILKEEADPVKLEKFNRVRMQLKLLTAYDVAFQTTNSSLVIAHSIGQTQSSFLTAGACLENTLLLAQEYPEHHDEIIRAYSVSRVIFVGFLLSVG